MGWSSGSNLFSVVWGAVRLHIPLEDRKIVAQQVMMAFENFDCDTLSECRCRQWPEIGEVLDEWYPPDEDDQ